jgi:hypothetical protein
VHKYGPTKIVDTSEYELILDTCIRWEHMHVNWAPIYVWHIYVYKNSYLRLNRSLYINKQLKYLLIIMLSFEFVY